MLGLFQRLLLLVALKLFNFSKYFKKQTLSFLGKLKRVLKTESKESKRMLEIYLKYTQSNASEEELKWANNQFADLLKTLGFGALIVLPFAPVTLPFVIKLSQKLGVDILPDSIKNELKE